MADFYQRVTRIQLARKNGYGHEAVGTLGRSHYTRAVPDRRSVAGPVLLLLVCFFLLSVFLYSRIGTEFSIQRAVSLMAGEAVDTIGG